MGGKKGGGGGHTPVEAPDSLLSSQRLSAIGIISLGPIKGPVNKWKSTYLDNTPIQNASGKDDDDVDSFNFTNMEIQYTLGTQDQLPMTGFDSSQREVPIGIEVKKELPITRSIIDPDVDRLRVTIGVNALFSQNDQGDTNGASVEFEILINGNLYKSYSINGKSSSRFYRSYIIDDLPPKPFNVTVRRVTADSKSQRLQNAIVWSSYTEIIDAKLSYPNIAMIGIKTDSRHTPNFPNVNSLLDGRIISVPSTYDPETRAYAPGIWRGDFKKEWTENPAWIFYDLATNPDVGIGKRISEYGLNKFQLYQIAQYCDELVPDGYGGKEPRMTAGIWITEQRSAYEVLNDMSSVFRAIVAWNGMQMLAIQDRPTDPVCTYSQANVIDGKFARQYVPLKSIYTAVEVEYADKNNMYQKAIEYVVDDEMVARYGYNVKKITAFACTSRGQARRYGKWVLVTSKLEQCTITFTVGREGLHHLPGDIIEVADNSWAKTNLGGRVVGINKSAVELDREIKIEGGSYLSYVVRDNNGQRTERVKILSVAGNVVNLESVPENLNPDDNWALQTPLVRTELYRAIGISENDGNYTITALQHEPQKQVIVDNSANFEPRNTTLHQSGVNPVNNADVSYGDNGIKLTWTAPYNAGTVRYDVKLYRNGNLYSTHLDLDSPEISFENLPSGSYTVEIRGKNGLGQLSDPVTRTFEINLNIPRFVTKSLLFAIELDWDLPKTFTPGFSTEIWRSNTNDISTAVKVATLPYPQSNYVVNGVPLSTGYYFYLRGVDKQGNKGEFTEAVFGEADHNPDNLLNALEGKITKSQLGQELINSIKTDINNAVGEEAKTRQTAVAGALAQIAAQAQSSGTAIKNLEKADQAQAETIKTVTAKAESALSGITAVRQAQAQSDKANAQQINALTAKVGNAESTVSQVSSAVAGLNGKVSSMHTIKTQAIAGGRTAVAGIALGANQEESSVIVMADKFGIVANANDGNVKPVFSVANGQVGIRGDLVVAGSVTRDKLSSSGGGNLLYNPIFANGAYGWRSFNDRGGDWSGCPETQAAERTYHKNDYHPKGEKDEAWRLITIRGTQTQFNTLAERGSWVDVARQFVDVVADKWYMASIYVGGNHCAGKLIIEKYDADERNYQGALAETQTAGADDIYNKPIRFISAPSGWFKKGLGQGATRLFVKFKAPETGKILLVIRIDHYAKNQTYADFYTSRPMLEECTEYTTEPSPWQNAGVTQVHGGSIIADTIRGNHIMANQEIRAPRITGGVITGNTVNGATVNGGTVNGAVVSGGTVKGATVEGGVIKGARLEAVTGKFSGTLEVNQLVGGNLCEVAIITVHRTLGFYQVWINIAPSPVKRIFFIVNSHKTFTVEANKSHRFLYTNHEENPPEFFEFRDGRTAKMCITAYAVSDTRTITQD
jgi:hypothetical protein